MCETARPAPRPPQASKRAWGRLRNPSVHADDYPQHNNNNIWILPAARSFVFLMSVTTWRCVPIVSSTPAGVAVIVYQLGPQSRASGGGRAHKQGLEPANGTPTAEMDGGGRVTCTVFEFAAADEPIGSVFLVTDEALPSARPPILTGRFGAARACSLHSSAPLPDQAALASMLASVRGAESHPVRIARFAMAKLEMLRHLPPDLDAVALLDADTFCARGCGRKLSMQVAGWAGTAGAKFSAQYGPGMDAADSGMDAGRTTAVRAAAQSPRWRHFVSASRSGMREWWVSGMNHTHAGHGVTLSRNADRRGVLRVRYEGINSGVLLLHLSRFRAFAAAYCPTRPTHEWHRCVVQRAPPDTDWRMSDQAVWNALIRAHHGIFRPLPCAFHAEGEVLSGVAACLGVERRQEERHPADDCKPSTRVVGGDAAADETFGVVPRWPVPPVAIVHGAAGRKALARTVAQRLSADGAPCTLGLAVPTHNV